MAFASGYLSGGGQAAHVERISEAAFHFGMAFQIYDDFDDVDQDKARGEQDLMDPNYINNFGLESAYTEFHNSLRRFQTIMTDLSLMSSLMVELSTFLTQHVDAKYQEFKSMNNKDKQ